MELEEPEARPSTAEQEAAEQPQEAAEEVDRARAELAQARSELDSTAKRLDEIARAYSALLNDQKDFRGRLEREKQRVLESERAKISLALVELGDELDRVMRAAADDEGPLAQGVRLIREGLLKRLSALGIERVSMVGKKFDPNLAEAVELAKVSDPSFDGLVLDESAPGYKIGERVLRPARVRVGRFAAEAAGGDPTQGTAGQQA
jgi:molecular chaperone GrpE